MTSLEHSVVVGVDGSAASTGAVAYAAHTAAKRGIPLIVVTSYSMPASLFAEGMVPPQPVYDELERECQPIIEQARATALDVAPDVQISHAVVEGNPSQVLIDYSRKAKMIVLGSRGLGGIKGMVLGSVSAAVASHAFCPVVVTREDTADLEKSGPVVVGVDGSEVSTKATERALVEAAPAAPPSSPGTRGWSPRCRRPPPESRSASRNGRSSRSSSSASCPSGSPDSPNGTRTSPSSGLSPATARSAHWSASQRARNSWWWARTAVVDSPGWSSAPPAGPCSRPPRARSWWCAPSLTTDR